MLRWSQLTGHRFIAERRANNHMQSKFTRKVEWEKGWEGDAKPIRGRRSLQFGSKVLLLLLTMLWMLLLSECQKHRLQSQEWTAAIQAMSWHIIVFQLDHAFLIFHSLLFWGCRGTQFTHISSKAIFQWSQWEIWAQTRRNWSSPRTEHLSGRSSKGFLSLVWSLTSVCWHTRTNTHIRTLLVGDIAANAEATFNWTKLQMTVFDFWQPTEQRSAWKWTSVVLSCVFFHTQLLHSLLPLQL